MKQFIIGTAVLLFTTLSFVGCKDRDGKYDGDAYVMFSDTLSICPVLIDNKEFSVNVASLTSVDYNRTYAVEIVNQKSNAVYEEHFQLDKSTVTIKAGETSATLKIKPIYDNIDKADSLGVELRLVSDLNDEYSGVGSSTKVIFQKVCPLDINDFTGYCRVYTKFLSDIQIGLSPRTFKCEKVEGEENTIWMRGLFSDGYDIKVKFEQTDPLKPSMKIVGKQLLGDTRDVMGGIIGDCRLWASEYLGYESTFSTCNKDAFQYMFVEVAIFKIIYPTYYEWIEPVEAE